MMFSAMLTDAFQYVDACFPIRYRFDGKLLNLRRLQAKSKVQTDVVDKLLYADDLAENAKSEEKIQGAVDGMSKACDNFQLTISTKKTEVVHQPSPGKPYSEPTITVNGQKLQVVDKSIYLGSSLSRAVQIDDEVTARTVKASLAFGRLRTNVWERNGIRLDTKLKVCKAVVLPTLLYACETWTVYQRPFPPKLPEETPENQVARQDPRHRGPEEGKDAKRTYSYSIEANTAKLDWPCHKNV